MVRRFALAAALAAAWVLPLSAAGTAVAQDATTECASAPWLEPLAAAREAAETAAQTASDAPAWLTTELTDACSGEAFALADFAGKTIYIEGMATWCTNCRQQLGRVKEAAAQISDAEKEDVVFVALSSEVDLPREALAQYAVDNEFPFVFAVMTAEMLQTMAEDLGQEIAVPPAMPLLIVAPDGTIGELHTGGTSAEDLLALLAAAKETTAS